MYVVRSDVGKKREINEDYYLVKKIDSACDIYIVADGLGGYECGEVASKICAESIYESILYEYEGISKSKNKDKYVSNMLKNIVSNVNEKIFNLEKTDIKYKGMGTTLLVVFRYFDTIYYLSIGDSRIYYINRNLTEIVRLTEDDTYVNTLVKTNIITYEESKNHPQKHILTKAVGVFKEIDTEVSKVDDKLDGYILLCTDGVTNMIKDHEILNIFKDNEFDIIAQKIVEESNDKGGIDNITALVIDISSLN
ncbi:MAG: protein phosphatase PrpC [Clostridia bacterium]|jgi:protein phosphatase|nr:protein phosphatase PrpC [Clostridia bacterium]